jgi:hypothetical protein
MESKIINYGNETNLKTRYLLLIGIGEYSTKPRKILFLSQ